MHESDDDFRLAVAQDSKKPAVAGFEV